MNYYNKIIELWKEMNADKEYFDSSDEAKDYLLKLLFSFSEYVSKTYEMEMILPFRKEYVDEYVKADEKRHLAHEKAIRSIVQLNNLCKDYKLSVFADIDTNDRYAVADFCRDIVIEIFNNRKL